MHERSSLSSFSLFFSLRFFGRPRVVGHCTYNPPGLKTARCVRRRCRGLESEWRKGKKKISSVSRQKRLSKTNLNETIFLGGRKCTTDPSPNITNPSQAKLTHFFLDQKSNGFLNEKKVAKPRTHLFGYGEDQKVPWDPKCLRLFLGGGCVRGDNPFLFPRMWETLILFEFPREMEEKAADDAMRLGLKWAALVVQLRREGKKSCFSLFFSALFLSRAPQGRREGGRGFPVCMGNGKIFLFSFF